MFADSSRRRYGLDPFWASWDGIEPFYGGKSAVPAHQTSLYYTCPSPEGDKHRCVNEHHSDTTTRTYSFSRSRIDFSKAGTDDLAALYNACKPASFGLNGETILDDTYRKAKKMDLDAFPTLFDPRNLGILERVSRGLLTRTRGPGITEMELYKLNVYGERRASFRKRGAISHIGAHTGKGVFFKRHQDTPRNESMVGSLVVVLPTQHEGGQLALRQGGKEWTVDFADAFAAATEPVVGFVAFFGDVEHEVLPVTSGYRVTLTYNLYRKPSHPSVSYIPMPFHERFKKALVEFINDKSTLPEGGYLGCGLVHEYVYTADKPINALMDRHKGADQILATICEELNLPCSLTSLYRNLCGNVVNLIARSKLTLPRQWNHGKNNEAEFLKDALRGLSIEEVEGVEITGRPFDLNAILDFEEDVDDEDLTVLQPFYRDPVTKILEIQPMSSVETATPWAYYGNEATLEYVYGHACMLIALDPAASRKELVL